MIEITLVVSTYQGLAVLREGLPSMLAQDLPAETWELLVVVDGSTDGTAEYLASLAAAPLRVITQPNRGLAAARNRGAREARGPIVVWLDDDARPQPGFARAHLETQRATGSVERVVFGPFPLLRRGRVSFLAEGVGRWADALAARMADPSWKPAMTDGCFANASLSRSLWERTGGFDERFRRYGNEDLDYARRLIHAEVPMGFAPGAVAFQDYRKRFRQWVAEWRDVGRADLTLWRRHPDAERELGFSRFAERHALRRRVFRAGLEESTLAALGIGAIEAGLRLADAWGLRGRPFDLLKWLPADHAYARGIASVLAELPDEAVPPSLSRLGL